MRVLVWVLLILAAGVGAAFSYYNWASVPFNYLAGQTELPLIALLLSAFVLGTAVGLLLMAGKLWGLGRDSRRLRKQIDNAEAELKSLRNLPLPADKPAPGSGNTVSR